MTDEVIIKIRTWLKDHPDIFFEYEMSQSLFERLKIDDLLRKGNKDHEMKVQ